VAAPGFYADPLGRHQVRWWDGSQWTCHVGGPGGVGIDDADGLPPVPILREPVLVFDELQPHQVGGAIDITTLAGVRVGTVRTRPTRPRWNGAGDVVSELRDITGLTLAVHTSPYETSKSRCLVHDPNGQLLGEFHRGHFGELTDVLLGRLLVARFPAAGSAVVVDVDGRPMAALHREGKVSWQSPFHSSRPDERWIFEMKASVSWPMYLLLLTVPIDSSVREDRRAASAYYGATSSGIGI